MLKYFKSWVTQLEIERYEQMTEQICIDTAINDAEKEITNGVELLDAREALTSLRRRHFG